MEYSTRTVPGITPEGNVEAITSSPAVCVRAVHIHQEAQNQGRRRKERH